MVGVSASVNLPLHHKVQKFSSGTGSPGWSQKKGRKMVVVWCRLCYVYFLVKDACFFCCIWFSLVLWCDRVTVHNNLNEPLDPFPFLGGC